MTKEIVTEKQKNKVRELCDSLSELFDIIYYEKEIKFAKNNYRNFDAEILIEHKYRRIIITIYPIFWKYNREIQRKIILHELCHTITKEQKYLSEKQREGKLVTLDEICNINEKTTSQIENILDEFLTKGDVEKFKIAYKKYLN